MNLTRKDKVMRKTIEDFAIVAMEIFLKDTRFDDLSCGNIAHRAAAMGKEMVKEIQDLETHEE